MILKKIPKGKPFFNAVVCVCFTGKDEVLLLRKIDDHIAYPGLYGFPAGKVKKKDKSNKHAVKREIKEETKNNVKLRDIIYLGTFPTRHRLKNGEYYYFYCHLYYLAPGIYIKPPKDNLDRNEHSASLVDGIMCVGDLHHMGKMIPDAYDGFLRVLKESKKAE